MMWGYYDHGLGLGFGMGLGFIGVIFNIIFWIIIFIILKKVLGGGCCGAHGKRNNALEILKERYAKGEITKKEFEERKKDLE